MDWCIWIYRELYWCKRSLIKKFCPVEEPQEDSYKVHADSLPWLWIGFAHSDGNSATMTKIVNNSLNYGLRVTPEYLDALTGLKDVQWKYIDTKTLEEKDFPSEGFVIEDVFDKQISDSE